MEPTPTSCSKPLLVRHEYLDLMAEEVFKFLHAFGTLHVGHEKLREVILGWHQKAIRGEPYTDAPPFHSFCSLLGLQFFGQTREAIHAYLCRVRESKGGPYIVTSWTITDSSDGAEVTIFFEDGRQVTLWVLPATSPPTSPLPPVTKSDKEIPS